MPTSGLLITCEQCGFRWTDGDQGPRLIMANNVTELTLRDVTINCPRCGGRARAEGGTYNVRGGQRELVRRLADDLRSAQATADDYARLLRVLRHAQAAGQGPEQVAEAIKAETPFTRLGETVRANWGAVGYVIAVLLTLITWLVPPPDAGLIGSAAGGHAPNSAISLEHMSPQQLNQLAQDILRQMDEDRAPITKAPSAIHQVKGSDRNKPCPCGSGKKAKKCCAGPPPRQP